jgi:aldehyde dehydrogenase (NAD+)
MLIDGELQHTAVARSSMWSTRPGGRWPDRHRRNYGRYGPALGAARRAFDTADWSRDVQFRYNCLMQLHEAWERNKEPASPGVGDRGGLPG